MDLSLPSLWQLSNEQCVPNSITLDLRLTRKNSLRQPVKIYVVIGQDGLWLICAVDHRYRTPLRCQLSPAGEFPKYSCLQWVGCCSCGVQGGRAVYIVYSSLYLINCTHYQVSNRHTPQRNVIKILDYQLVCDFVKGVCMCVTFTPYPMSVTEPVTRDGSQWRNKGLWTPKRSGQNGADVQIVWSLITLWDTLHV